MADIKASTRRSLLAAGALSFFAVLLPGCGPESPEEAHLSPMVATAATAARGDGDRLGGELTLTAVNDYQIDVVGCATGLTATISALNPSLNLYAGDHNCLGRLTQFQENGEWFTPAGGTNFTTWLPGDEAVFVGAVSGLRRLVRVIAQLSTPLDPTDVIDYRISNVQGDPLTHVVMGLNPGATGRVTVGAVDGPWYVLRTKVVLAAVGASETFDVQFYLECSARLQQSNTPSKAECRNQKLSLLRYLLVEDTYNDVPCSTAIPAPCQGMFNGSEKSINLASAEYIAPGAVLANGGFVTKTVAAGALRAPANVAAHPNMLLMLSNGTAFQYFNVDLITQEALP